MTYVIAEIGFNHEGDLDLAVEMIRAAARAGADAVKFQTYRAEDILSPASPDFEEFRAGEMDPAAHRRLADEAVRAGVEFMSTPFSRRAVDLLEETGVRRYKIASMDLTNYDLLGYVAQTGKPLIVSTGMAGLAEIAATLEFLSGCGAEQISLLHCISQYPSEASELNLEVIGFLKATFMVPVGYSDHFPGVKACLAAAMLGADILETHFTLDSTKPGADHSHSATPEQLRDLIEDIHLFKTMAGESASGGSSYLKNRSDAPNRTAFRRGIHAALDLESGDVLNRASLLACRPEADFGPNDLEWLMGRKIRARLSRHQPLTREHV